MGEKKLSIICIQETMLGKVDYFMCNTLWGSCPHGFSFKSSVGASGGLLTMWDSEEVDISYSSFDHVLAVGSSFLHFGEDFVLFNVYAPCDVPSQSLLRKNLSSRLANYVGHLVCVCGGFNVVRGTKEWRNAGIMHRATGVSSFKKFIDGNDLIDLPLIGRRFTWYLDDDHSMCHINRFLLSESWCLRWPNCLQAAQLCGLSNHCAIILFTDEPNLGPCHFCMLKC